MENDNRNVFGRLNSQDQKLDSINEVISKQQSQISNQSAIVLESGNDKQTQVIFIKNLKKYLWFGRSSEFYKSR